MKTKNIIIFLSILASIVIAWQFALPLWDKIGLKKEQNSRQKQDVEKMEDLISKLKEFISVYEQKQAQAEQLSKFLPAGENISGILNSVETMGAQAGVIIDSIEWSLKSDKEEVQSVPVEGAGDGSSGVQTSQNSGEGDGIKIISVGISAAGTYESFKNFIANLESSIRLVEIRQIGLTAKGESGNLFDFEIKGDMYYQ